MYVPTLRGKPLHQLSRHVTKETKGMSCVQIQEASLGKHNREEHHE